MKYINKSLVWVALPGLQRDMVIDEIAATSVDYSDKGNHVWSASMTNEGTILFCYALQVDEYTSNGKTFNSWYIKRIPESVGPDVYDCPFEIMDMCKMTNIEWRQRVLASQKK